MCWPTDEEFIARLTSIYSGRSVRLLLGRKISLFRHIISFICQFHTLISHQVIDRFFLSFNYARRLDGQLLCLLPTILRLHATNILNVLSEDYHYGRITERRILACLHCRSSHLSPLANDRYIANRVSMARWKDNWNQIETVIYCFLAISNARFQRFEHCRALLCCFLYISVFSHLCFSRRYYIPDNTLGVGNVQGSNEVAYWPRPNLLAALVFNVMMPFSTSARWVKWMQVSLAVLPAIKRHAVYCVKLFWSPLDST